MNNESKINIIETVADLKGFQLFTQGDHWQLMVRENDGMCALVMSEAVVLRGSVETMLAEVSALRSVMEHYPDAYSLLKEMVEDE